MIGNACRVSSRRRTCGTWRPLFGAGARTEKRLLRLTARFRAGRTPGEFGLSNEYATHRRARPPPEHRFGHATALGYGSAVSVRIRPVLTARDAASAVEFYKRAFGAIESNRVTGPTGTIV